VQCIVFVHIRFFYIIGGGGSGKEFVRIARRRLANKLFFVGGALKGVTNEKGRG
jgi:hypothetical protein